MKLKSLFKSIIPKKFHLLIFEITAKLLHCKYKGKIKQCPCCNAWLKDFAPFSQAHSAADRYCTNCLCFSRHRLLFPYLKNELDSFNIRDIKLLHIAPEKCLENIFRSNANIEYTSIDLNNKNADKLMDLTNLKFSDKAFDLIIAVHVLEHINNDLKAMKEIHRVLKPTGKAIILVPIDYQKANTYEDNNLKSYFQREKAYGQGDHMRLYGIDFSNKLVDAGFKVEAVNYAKKLSDNYIKQNYIYKDEQIFICQH